MSGLVYYSTSTDWTPPRVGDVRARTGGRRDHRRRLRRGRRRLRHPPRRRPVPGRRATGRRSTSLRAAGRSPGTLTVPAAIANEQIRVVIQVVDGAGNVATASSKGPGFAPVPPPPAGADDHAHAGRTAVRLVHGAADDHRRTVPASTTVTVVDRRRRAAAVHRPVRAERARRRLARRRRRRQSTAPRPACIVRIDTHAPPTISAQLSPPANVNGWRNTPVTATFTCADAASGVADVPAAGLDRRSRRARRSSSAGRRPTAPASRRPPRRRCKVDLTPPTCAGGDPRPGVASHDRDHADPRRHDRRACPASPAASGGSATTPAGRGTPC